MHNPIFFGLLASILFSCFGKTEENQRPKAYNLSSPIKNYTLLKELKEISGIHYINDSRIACIQDEKGEIYFYNPSSGNIDQVIKFGEKGDYEDIVQVDNTFFILRNDGTLFKYSNSQTTSFDTYLSKENNTESLCYDKANKRLIIGCKNGKKTLYAFDLHSFALLKDPLFTISQKIDPTAINIHPLTGEWYVLSKEKLLILNHEGIIKGEYTLSSDLFGQPEGITFKLNGNLLISNEGGKGNGTILEFKYTPNEQ